MEFAKLVLIVLIPLIGTAVGAACVYFMKGGLNPGVRGMLSGFAAGVMTAASVWSLLIPAMERSAHLGQWSVLPALLGILCGVGIFRLLPEKDGADSRLLAAVTLHNFPEGMAVGAAAALWLAEGSAVSFAEVLVLAVGIGLQNLPEGAIISMPLHCAGMRKRRAFAMGTLSGVVEPVGALLTAALSALLVPVLPFLLSFSAGAMLYVVVEELIPDASAQRSPSVSFAVGFSLMMAMDTLLG